MWAAVVSLIGKLRKRNHKIPNTSESFPKVNRSVTMFVMKGALSLVLLGCLAPAATASSVPFDVGPRTTAKGANEFVACFAGAQQRAALPWSYVPRESGGGVLSNAGATGVGTPYFLDVNDRGSTREIRLEQGSAPSQFQRAVLTAVDRCI